MEGESEMMTSSSSVGEVGVDSLASARKANEEARKATAVINFFFPLSIFFICYLFSTYFPNGCHREGDTSISWRTLREASIVGCMRCWIGKYTNLQGYAAKRTECSYCSSCLCNGISRG